MKRIVLALAVAALSGPALAQTAPTPTPAAAPAPPYGAPISLADAQALIERAMAEARSRNFRMAFAVVEPSGELVAFARMDDVQYASIEVSQRKAETAARFRRPTSSHEEGVAGGRHAILGVSEIIPLSGGVPIIVDGRVVGAIGVSGASSAQDDEVARAALAR
ncbi:GlcG/HbpS family heme-binding protein [Brevundimonas lenta]|uniref:Uncharacterized protein GlcG (DUF336 family) n=1 Tax=Brevundimonas lenta TaxID=424796 RepID=A0A7W6JCL5_9CAUL|nr:heme-binding protein [Brevundimonas lenta]MBB4082612.1 uncharacterized protein GlcG (DUF336 family) [Brevundimonas lenta]